MQAHRNDHPTSSPRSGSPETGKSWIKTTQRLAHRPNILRESARFALTLRRSIVGNLTAVFIVANLIGAACSLPVSLASATPSVPPTERPAATETPAAAPTPAPTQTPAPAETETPEPAATPTETLVDLEILEWSEFPYKNLADPANTDTHVEMLIRNPNEQPVRVLDDGVELRFLNASGNVVYANPSPVFYIWEGSWMLPGETAALSACVCFWSSGLEKKEWVSLELVAPIETATDLAYTLDVNVTLGEFFSLAEAHLGGSGMGAEITLTNTSDEVLESVPLLVFARDMSGRYIGMATRGNAVASFTENIGIQPGDTATGVVVNDIDYFDEPMTYEVRALGILAASAATAEPDLAGTPVAEWRGVPIMPGAVSGGEADDGYRFSTQASVDETVQFYKDALTDLGYSLSMSGEESGITFLIFAKDSTTVVVGIQPAAERNLVQISVTP